MDPSSNFYNYRTALRGAAQRSLTAHSNREKVRTANDFAVAEVCKRCLFVYLMNHLLGAQLHVKNSFFEIISCIGHPSHLCCREPQCPGRVQCILPVQMYQGHTFVSHLFPFLPFHTFTENLFPSGNVQVLPRPSHPTCKRNKAKG